MSTGQPTPVAEVLLAHRRFLRSVVRALLRSDDDAEDVVQETLMRASQVRLPPVRGLRGWLAGVARNLSIDHVRARHRRERLHASIEPMGVSPSPAEVLEHEEQRQRVVRAVLALPTPYRTVVLLCFWEGLAPAMIAQRLEMPGATVRSHLRRGLQMLRDRLDENYGSRTAWIAVLAPFARTEGTAAAATHSTMGVLLMTKTRCAVSLAGLLLVGVLGWTWWPSAPQPTPMDGKSRALAEVSSGTGAAAMPTADPPPAPATTEDRATAIPSGALAVHGQVLHKGMPYAGLVITLQWFAGHEADGPVLEEHAVPCDHEGRFIWHGALRKAVATVQALTPGQPLRTWCTPLVVQPDQHDAELEVQVIPLDRVLYGRVHDKARTPIADARLTINMWPQTEVTSDAGGSYEMRVPAPGYPLLVRAPGCRTRVVNGYLPADSMRHEFDVELERGEQRSGRVVDEQGAPVAGAIVGASGLFHSFETDAEGRFLIDGMAPGSRHLLSVKKAGYQPIETGMSTSSEPIEVVLKPGINVDVRVLAADGAPVPGAVLNVVKDQFRGWQRKGVTGGDGRVRVADLGTGSLRFVADKPGFQPAWTELDPSQAKGEIVLTLRRGFSLRGQVLAEDGAPVVGASIYCERTGATIIAQRPVGSRANTRADGRFEIIGLPAEACTVYAHHPEHTRASFAFVGGATQETELRMAPAPAVAGRVVDGLTGTPVDTFTVVVTAKSTAQALHMDPLPFRESDGYWLARHWQMQAGAPLIVEIRAEGYAPARSDCVATVKPPRDQYVVRLSRGARVEGIVRDATTERPILGAAVSLVRPGARTSEATGRERTDADGRFALANVNAGDHQLLVEHADYLPTTVPFTVVDGSEVQTVQPRLARGVLVRGRIEGVSTAAGLRIEARAEDLRTVECRVRDDLTFELVGVRPGDTRFTVLDSNGRSRTRRMRVENKDLEGLVLPLRTGTGVVRIKVLVGSAQAKDGVVSVVPIAGGDADLIPFTLGACVADGLAPGRYRISAHLSEGALRGSGEVDVGAGEVEVTVVCAESR